MTHLQAGNARRIEAEAAMLAERFEEANRDFTLAAEQFEKAWWEMHRTIQSPDAYNMRQKASEARRAERAAQASNEA